MTRIAPNLKDAVVLRAGNRCEYCHLRQEIQVATFPVDHILPIFKLGLTELENLALACPRCNARKWIHTEALDPDTGEVAPLFNPRTQKWNDHFCWSKENPTIIEGLNTIGRATIAFLDLNASQHQAIRALVHSLDLPGEDVKS